MRESKPMQPNPLWKRTEPRTSQCGRYVEFDAQVISELVAWYAVAGVSVLPGTFGAHDAGRRK